MSDVEILKKHIFKPVPFSLTSEDGSKDIIYLKPLTVGQQSLVISISKRFQKFGKPEKGKEEDYLKNIDDNERKETMDMAFDLLVSVIKRSIEGIDDETAKEFVNSNFNELFGFIEELFPKTVDKDKVELVKKKLEERQKNESA